MRRLSLSRPPPTIVTPTIQQHPRNKLPLDSFGRPVAGFDPFAPPTPLPMKTYTKRNIKKKAGDAGQEEAPETLKDLLKKELKKGGEGGKTGSNEKGGGGSEERGADTAKATSSSLDAGSSSSALNVKKEGEKVEGAGIKVKKEGNPDARLQELLKPSMKQLYSEEMALMAREKLRFERELMQKMSKEQEKLPALPSLSQLTTLRNKPDDLQVAMDRLVDNMKRIGSTDDSSTVPQGELTKHLNQMMDMMQKDVFLGTVRTEVYQAEENMFAEAANSYVRISGMTQLSKDDYSRGVMAVKAEREKEAKREAMRRGWDERRKEKRREVRRQAKGAISKKALAGLTEAQRLRRSLPAPRTPPGSPPEGNSPPVSTRGSRDNTPDRLPQPVTPPGSPPPMRETPKKTSAKRLELLLDDAFDEPLEETEREESKEYAQREAEKKKEIAQLQNQYDWALYKYKERGAQSQRFRGQRGRPRLNKGPPPGLQQTGRSKELAEWMGNQKQEQWDSRMKEILHISETNLDSASGVEDMFDLPSSSKRPSILNRPQQKRSGYEMKIKPLFPQSLSKSTGDLRREEQSMDGMMETQMNTEDGEMSLIQPSQTPLGRAQLKQRQLKEGKTKPLNHSILNWAMDSVRKEDEPEEAAVEEAEEVMDADDDEELGIERAVGKFKGQIIKQKLQESQQQQQEREQQEKELRRLHAEHRIKDAVPELDSLMEAGRPKNRNEIKKRIDETNEVFTEMHKSLGCLDLSRAGKVKKITAAVKTTSAMLQAMEVWLKNRQKPSLPRTLEGETKEEADRQQAQIEYRLGLLAKLAEDLPENIQELATREVPTADPKEAKAVLDLRARIVSVEKLKEKYLPPEEVALKELEKMRQSTPGSKMDRNADWKVYAEDFKNRMQRAIKEKKRKEEQIENEKQRARQRVMLGGLVVGLYKGQSLSKSKELDDHWTRGKKRRTVLIRKEFTPEQRASLILSEFYKFWRAKESNDKTGKKTIKPTGVISDIEEEGSERGNKWKEEGQPGTSKDAVSVDSTIMKPRHEMAPNIQLAYDIWRQERKLTNEVRLNTGYLVDENELEEVEVPEGMAGFYEDTRPYQMNERRIHKHHQTVGDDFVLRMTERERIHNKRARGEELTKNEKNFLQFFDRKKTVNASPSLRKTEEAMDDSMEEPNDTHHKEPIRIPARRRGEGEETTEGGGATRVVVTRVPGGGSRLRVVSAIDVTPKAGKRDADASEVLIESDEDDIAVVGTVSRPAIKKENIVWKPASKSTSSVPAVQKKDDVHLVMDEMLRKICGDEEQVADALDVTPFSKRTVIISRPVTTVPKKLPIGTAKAAGAFGVSTGQKEVFWKPPARKPAVPSLITTSAPVSSRFVPTPRDRNAVRDVMEAMLKIVCAPPKHPERYTRAAILHTKQAETTEVGGVKKESASGSDVTSRRAYYGLESDAEDDVIELDDEEEGGSSGRGRQITKRRKQSWKSSPDRDDDEPIVIEEEKEKNDKEGRSEEVKKRKIVESESEPGPSTSALLEEPVKKTPQVNRLGWIDCLRLVEEQEEGESTRMGIMREKMSKIEKKWMAVDEATAGRMDEKKGGEARKTGEGREEGEEAMPSLSSEGRSVGGKDEATGDLLQKRYFTTSAGKRILLKPRRPIEEGEQASTPSPLSRRLVAMAAAPATAAKTRPGNPINDDDLDDVTPSRRVMQKREERKRRAYSPEVPLPIKKQKILYKKLSTPVTIRTTVNAVVKPTPSRPITGTAVKPPQKVVPSPAAKKATSATQTTAAPTATAKTPLARPIGLAEKEKEWEKEKAEKLENFRLQKQQSWDIRKNEATIDRQKEQIEMQKKLLAEMRNELMKTFENADKTNKLVEQTRRAMIGECQDFAEYRKLVDAREKLMNTLYEQTMEKMKATVAAEETRLRAFENYKEKAVKREKALIKEVEIANGQLEKIQDQKMTVAPPKTCPVPFTKAPVNGKRVRTNFVVEAVRRVLGDGVEGDKELEKEQVKAIVERVLRRFNIETKMSMALDREFCTLHEISYRKRVEMKKFLTKKGLDIFCSYRQFEKMRREDNGIEEDDEEIEARKEKERKRKKEKRGKKMVDARDISLGSGDEDEASDGDIEEILIDEDYNLIESGNRTDGEMSGREKKKGGRRNNSARVAKSQVLTSDEEYVEEESDPDEPGPSNRYIPLPARFSSSSGRAAPLPPAAAAPSHYLHGPPLQQQLHQLQQRNRDARRGRGGARVRGGHS